MSGFIEFLRKHEGKEPVSKYPDWFYYEGKKKPKRKLRVEKIVRGEVGYLWCSFTWALTPQGFIYWDERSDGTKELDETDILYLRYLEEYHST